LSQYHRNSRYTMAKRTNVLRTHMLHNRARQQINQIVKTTVQYVHHSVKPQPSVCHAMQWSVDLLMICWSRFSQQVRLCHWDRPCWKSECDTCSAAEPPFSVVNIVQVRAFGSYTDGSIKFHKTLYSYVNSIICVNNLRHYNIHCVLLYLGSFTNLVICIYVLKTQTIKLAHTLDIDCFLTCNYQFCFCLTKSWKNNVTLGVRFFIGPPCTA